MKKLNEFEKIKITNKRLGFALIIQTVVIFVLVIGLIASHHTPPYAYILDDDTKVALKNVIIGKDVNIQLINKTMQRFIGDFRIGDKDALTDLHVALNMMQKDLRSAYKKKLSKDVINQINASNTKLFHTDIAIKSVSEFKNNKALCVIRFERRKIDSYLNQVKENDIEALVEIKMVEPNTYKPYGFEIVSYMEKEV